MKRRWGPRNNHEIMRGLLPIKKKIGSAKSPVFVEVDSERGMNCYDSF